MCYLICSFLVSFYLLLPMYVCVQCRYMYAYLGMLMHLCECVCSDQKLTLGVLFNDSLPYILSQGFWIKPRAH